jgi:superfamily II DNA or RNA helicase
MTVTLRPYQAKAKAETLAAWAAGRRVVILRMDTGAGKTATLASIIQDHVGASCVIAHRDTIVSQLSIALAACGVRHNIIASEKNRRKIAERHVKIFGRSFFDPNAPCVVASVDTLVRRKGLENWAASVTLWVIDEGHHLVVGNKWHTAISKFTNPAVRGLLPTATPERADGQGLGSEELGGAGVADFMVEGPPMRWLINEGYLCDYRVVCADSHVVDLLGAVGKTGDWSTAQLKAAEGQTPIIGDAVKTYRNLNAGCIRGVPASQTPRRAVVFASSVERATEMLTAYRSAGFVAELITGETDDAVRWRIFDRLEAGQVHVILAVDVISEGTDFPALEVATLARASASKGLVRQQIGRVLRPLMTPEYKAAQTREQRLAAIAASPKPIAYVVDHVGNFTRHGPPDRPCVWNLASTRGKNEPSDAIQFRACLNVPECGQPYEKFRTCCPYCGSEPPPPAARASPAAVDGDMVMMDPAMLEALRNKAAEAVMSLDDYRAKLAATGLPQHFIWRNAKTHAPKIEAQKALRETMAVWGGIWHARGLSDREIQKLFFERFGVDVLTCLAFGPNEAGALIEKILFDAPVI